MSVQVSSIVRDPQLRELAHGALRRAAHAARAARVEDAVDADARELVRRTCNTARERGLRAEQLLLVLKEAWRELPEAQRIPRYNSLEVLARVITVCIHEYYARPLAQPIDCSRDGAGRNGRDDGRGNAGGST